MTQLLSRTRSDLAGLAAGASMSDVLAQLRP